MAGGIAMEIPATYHGKPLIAQWVYCDFNGAPIGIVGRYQNGVAKKDIVPFFKRDGSHWLPGIELNPRPLYGLEKSRDHPKNKIVFVTEGEKCASVLQDIGCVAVASLGGSKSASKTDWSQLNGYQFIYLLPDFDKPGETYIEDVYKILSTLPEPPEIKILRLPDLPASGDVADWLQLLVADWNGFESIPENMHEALREELKEVLKHAEPIPQDWLETELIEPKPFPLVCGAELTAKPRPLKYLVDNFIQANALIQIFGRSYAGKTFLILDLIFCISNGISWHGSETKKGTIVLVIGEGLFGIRIRLKALELKYKIKAENLYISEMPASLIDSTNCRWIAEAINKLKPSLIVFDTLARNFGGGSENSSQDMSCVISNVDRFLKGNASIIFVHHTGHENKSRARGSSSIYAALDEEFEVSQADEIITLKNTKMKDGAVPPDISFRKILVDIGWLDQKNQTVKTLTLETTDSQPKTDQKKKLSARDESVMTSLFRAIEGQGIKPTPEIMRRFGGFDDFHNSEKRIVHLDYWHDQVYPALDVDSEPSNKRVATS